MTNNYHVAVYYFPNYHRDPQNEQWHGSGWTEWELVKRATPRFPGHQQPKEPLWGYEDESHPDVMAKKIQAAADHGIDSFIFDWYWHEDGPYLERALEQGFLKAHNTERLQFALMWANHDWVDIHPAQRNMCPKVLKPGKLSPQAFVEATDHIIHAYFSRPNYWRVNGGLYFSFYELTKLLAGFGTIAETRAALDDFRARTRKAGLGELHLNAVVWNTPNLPGEETILEVNPLMEQLGFDSITSYVWIHHHEMPDFPTTSYAAFREISVNDYKTFTGQYQLPYFPNVTMGWDSTPRTIQSDVYDNLGYPFTPILQGNTPEEFTTALQAVKTFLDTGKTCPKIFTINAWNEWTEGSCLEPDTEHGMRYLEAIKSVFGETS
ncbi:MAG: hypothetical protein GY801_07985 [bacterium]|nr:hypothetical protein [bacterium]